MPEKFITQDGVKLIVRVEKSVEDGFRFIDVEVEVDLPGYDVEDEWILPSGIFNVTGSLDIQEAEKWEYADKKGEDGI